MNNEQAKCYSTRTRQSNKAVICKAVARQLNKDPNELTEKDFARITELCIAEKTGQGIGLNTEGYNTATLSDITFLKKFVNLQELDLSYLKCPKKDIPKWKYYLVKIGIYKPPKRTEKPVLDLRPLKKLTRLRKLKIIFSPISDIKPLASLTKLESLDLSRTHITDIVFGSFGSLIVRKETRVALRNLSCNFCRRCWR